MAHGHHGQLAQYSMRIVTRLTGLSADTIRAWERRYDAVVPHRTKGNTRRYTAEDVRRLSLLKEATERGYRIGDIARLSEEELRGLSGSEEGLSSGSTGAVEPALSVENTLAAVRAEYMGAIERFDARAGGDLLARAAAIFRPREFVLGLILPIMRETGDRWLHGELSVAQEHLVSMQARSLLDAILRHSSPHKGAPRIIAATPEGQLHELGALAGAMLAALRGFDVLYLGAQVPADDLLTAVGASGTAIVLLSIVYDGSRSKNAELARTIDAIAAQNQVWVGVSKEHGVATMIKKAVIFNNYEDFDIAMTKLLS